MAAADTRTWQAARDGEGIVVVAVEADQAAPGPRESGPREAGLRESGPRESGPRESGPLTPVAFKPGHPPMVVYSHLVHGRPPRAFVGVRDAWLEAPVLAGVVTSIVVGRTDTSVGLFDLGLLSHPRLVVMLDRAQGLLGAGRTGPAGLLLERVRRDSSSRVAEFLLEGVRAAAPPGALARGRSPADAHALLEGTPWAVLVQASGSGT